MTSFPARSLTRSFLTASHHQFYQRSLLQSACTLFLSFILAKVIDAGVPVPSTASHLLKVILSKAPCATLSCKMSAPASLFTCRYWAFGPSCPNILHGKNVCRSSDFDEFNADAPQVCSRTGILADLHQNLTREERAASGCKAIVQEVQRVAMNIARQVLMVCTKAVSHLIPRRVLTKIAKASS